MSDLELSNYMFNIIRIGSLYESNTSVKTKFKNIIFFLIIIHSLFKITFS